MLILIYLLIKISKQISYNQTETDWDIENCIYDSAVDYSPINIHVDNTLCSDDFFGSLVFDITNTANSCKFHLGQIPIQPVIDLPSDFANFYIKSVNQTVVQYQSTTAYLRHPSEHQIDLKQYPMELQIHFKKSQNSPSKIESDNIIISFLFEEVESAQDEIGTELIDDYLNFIHHENLNRLIATNEHSKLLFDYQDTNQINQILNEKFEFFYYRGSLTYDDCSPNKIYIISKQIFKIQSEKIQQYKRLLFELTGVDTNAKIVSNLQYQPIIYSVGDNCQDLVTNFVWFFVFYFCLNFFIFKILQLIKLNNQKKTSIKIPNLKIIQQNRIQQIMQQTTHNTLSTAKNLTSDAYHGTKNLVNNGLHTTGHVAQDLAHGTSNTLHHNTHGTYYPTTTNQYSTTHYSNGKNMVQNLTNGTHSLGQHHGHGSTLVGQSNHMVNNMNHGPVIEHKEVTKTETDVVEYDNGDLRHSGLRGSHHSEKVHKHVTKTETVVDKYAPGTNTTGHIGTTTYRTYTRPLNTSTGLNNNTVKTVTHSYGQNYPTTYNTSQGLNNSNVVRTSYGSNHHIYKPVTTNVTERYKNHGLGTTTTHGHHTGLTTSGHDHHHTGLTTGLNTHTPNVGLTTGHHHDHHTGLTTGLNTHTPNVGLTTSGHDHHHTGLTTTGHHHDHHTGLTTGLNTHTPNTGLLTTGRHHDHHTGLTTDKHHHTGLTTTGHHHDHHTGLTTGLNTHTPNTGLVTTTHHTDGLQHHHDHHHTDGLLHHHDHHHHHLGQHLPESLKTKYVGMRNVVSNRPIVLSNVDMPHNLVHDHYDHSHLFTSYTTHAQPIETIKTTTVEEHITREPVVETHVNRDVYHVNQLPHSAHKTNVVTTTYNDVPLQTPKKEVDYFDVETTNVHPVTTTTNTHGYTTGNLGHTTTNTHGYTTGTLGHTTGTHGYTTGYTSGQKYTTNSNHKYTTTNVRSSNYQTQPLHLGDSNINRQSLHQSHDSNWYKTRQPTQSYKKTQVTTTNVYKNPTSSYTKGQTYTTTGSNRQVLNQSNYSNDIRNSTGNTNRNLYTSQAYNQPTSYSNKKVVHAYSNNKVSTDYNTSNMQRTQPSHFSQYNQHSNY